MKINKAASWSKGTKFSRPGGVKCDFCAHVFRSKEKFGIKEVKTSWFRGDDEVYFYCFECLPAMVRRMLKL